MFQNDNETYHNSILGKGFKNSKFPKSDDKSSCYRDNSIHSTLSLFFFQKLEALLEILV